MKATPIAGCRLCGCKALTTVADLGLMASCGVFPTADQPDPPRAPLEVIVCDECGLSQLRHDFDGEDLFRHTYGYRSGLNASMVTHLAALTGEITKRAGLKSGDIILDIGSNDGTTLGSYTTEGLVRFGIDPTSANFKQYYKPDITAVPDFFTAETLWGLSGGRRCKVVTSIAMFYDLADPNKFARDVAKVLAPDGIWILEQSYLPSMIEANSFDTICHEHIEYYGLKQLDELLGRNGMKIFDVSLNDINGGSSQVWACHSGGPYEVAQSKIDTLLNKEKAEGYGTPAPWERLMKNSEAARAEALAFLSQAKAAGKLVHGCGASTKGNTLLQYYGIGPDLLPAIAEVNPEKFGCRTPGTSIPIISEAESRKLTPDYYFALPWHFRDSLLKREKDFIARGGQLVFPLPKFDVTPAR